MSLVINIRGTSGSGKSTLVRKLMEFYQNVEPVHIENRKQPIAYNLSGGGPLPSLTVIGHYETACGGCDTITQQDEIFDRVRTQAKEAPVVFEGLLVSAEFNRTAALKLKHGLDLRVVHIEIPLEECVKSVNSRRREKKPEAPDVNPKNTESKWKGTRRTCERLMEAGVPVFKGNRDECLNHVLWTLRNA